MHVARIKLRNWLRYVGEHEVALGPGVYAVTAEFDGDGRRSNWAGKTAFLEAIRFALFGVHRKDREDDWITEGESDGGVTLTLSSGEVIERTRKRGHPTRVRVVLDGREAIGETAAAALGARLGMTRDDFDSTCWIGQKQLSKFVLARPAERMELVSDWLGLGPLQRCEERAREAQVALVKRMGEAEGRRANTTRVIADARVTVGVEQNATVAVLCEMLRAEIAGYEVRVERARDALAKAHDLRAAVRERAAVLAARQEFVALRDELGELKRVHDSLEETAAEVGVRRAEFEGLHGRMLEAGKDAKQKGALARGEFDGKCPVGGVACPIAKDLNASRKANAKAHECALGAYDSACKAANLARCEMEEAESAARKRGEIAIKRENMLARMKRAKDQGSVEVVGLNADEAQGEVAACESEHAAEVAGLTVARARLAALESASGELGVADGALAGFKQDARAIQTVRRLFGRQGAQRVVAQRALSDITDGANALLVDAGIPLRVQMAWVREAASGLAASCENCGAAFPASQRVKACEGCGAARGTKQLERLDVELSDRSGAAEDLAGAALQLSASAWLRAERAIAWGVACIDEPFGALDESNRKAFAAHLLTMLGGRYGFEQAFIVAHSTDVLDAIPNRVRVFATEYGSTMKVD